MLGGQSRAGLGSLSRIGMGQSVYRVRSPKNTRILTGSRVAVLFSRNLVDTEFLPCPNRIRTRTPISYRLIIVLRGDCLDWDYTIAAKTAAIGIHGNGGIEIIRIE